MIYRFNLAIAVIDLFLFYLIFHFKNGIEVYRDRQY